jgi:hypothetical protein
MAQDFQAEIESVNRIAAVPTILEVVCRTTGVGFATLARVTEDRWITCNVLDEIDFGLRTGGELRIETTICHEVRQLRASLMTQLANNLQTSRRCRSNGRPRDGIPMVRFCSSWCACEL